MFFFVGAWDHPHLPKTNALNFYQLISTDECPTQSHILSAALSASDKVRSEHSSLSEKWSIATRSRKCYEAKTRARDATALTPRAKVSKMRGSILTSGKHYKTFSGENSKVIVLSPTPLNILKTIINYFLYSWFPPKSLLTFSTDRIFTQAIA